MSGKSKRKNDVLRIDPASYGGVTVLARLCAREFDVSQAISDDIGVGESGHSPKKIKNLSESEFPKCCGDLARRLKRCKQAISKRKRSSPIDDEKGRVVAVFVMLEPELAQRVSQFINTLRTTMCSEKLLDRLFEHLEFGSLHILEVLQENRYAIPGRLVSGLEKAVRKFYLEPLVSITEASLHWFRTASQATRTRKKRRTARNARRRRRGGVAEDVDMPDSDVQQYSDAFLDRFQGALNRIWCEVLPDPLLEYYFPITADPDLDDDESEDEFDSEERDSAQDSTSSSVPVVRPPETSIYDIDTVSSLLVRVARSLIQAVASLQCRAAIRGRIGAVFLHMLLRPYVRLATSKFFSPSLAAEDDAAAPGHRRLTRSSKRALLNLTLLHRMHLRVSLLLGASVCGISLSDSGKAGSPQHLLLIVSFFQRLRVAFANVSSASKQAPFNLPEVPFVALDAIFRDVGPVGADGQVSTIRRAKKRNGGKGAGATLRQATQLRRQMEFFCLLANVLPQFTTPYVAMVVAGGRLSTYQRLLTGVGRRRFAEGVARSVAGFAVPNTRGGVAGAIMTFAKLFLFDRDSFVRRVAMRHVPHFGSIFGWRNDHDDGMGSRRAADAYRRYLRWISTAASFDRVRLARLDALKATLRLVAQNPFLPVVTRRYALEAVEEAKVMQKKYISVAGCLSSAFGSILELSGSREGGETPETLFDESLRVLRLEFRRIEKAGNSDFLPARVTTPFGITVICAYLCGSESDRTQFDISAQWLDTLVKEKEGNSDILDLFRDVERPLLFSSSLGRVLLRSDDDSTDLRIAERALQFVSEDIRKCCLPLVVDALSAACHHSCGDAFAANGQNASMAERVESDDEMKGRRFEEKDPYMDIVHFITKSLTPSVIIETFFKKRRKKKKKGGIDEKVFTENEREVLWTIGFDWISLLSLLITENKGGNPPLCVLECIGGLFLSRIWHPVNGNIAAGDCLSSSSVDAFVELLADFHSEESGSSRKNRNQIRQCALDGLECLLSYLVLQQGINIELIVSGLLRSLKRELVHLRRSFSNDPSIRKRKSLLVPILRGLLCVSRLYESTLRLQVSTVFSPLLQLLSSSNGSNRTDISVASGLVLRILNKLYAAPIGNNTRGVAPEVLIRFVQRSLGWLLVHCGKETVDSVALFPQPLDALYCLLFELEMDLFGDETRLIEAIAEKERTKSMMEEEEEGEMMNAESSGDSDGESSSDSEIEYQPSVYQHKSAGFIATIGIVLRKCKTLWLAESTRRLQWNSEDGEDERAPIVPSSTSYMAADVEREAKAEISDRLITTLITQGSFFSRYLLLVQRIVDSVVSVDDMGTVSPGLRPASEEVSAAAVATLGSFMLCSMSIAKENSHRIANILRLGIPAMGGDVDAGELNLDTSVSAGPSVIPPAVLVNAMVVGADLLLFIPNELENAGNALFARLLDATATFHDLSVRKAALRLVGTMLVRKTTQASDIVLSRLAVLMYDQLDTGGTIKSGSEEVLSALLLCEDAKTAGSLIYDAFVAVLKRFLQVPSKKMRHLGWTPLAVLTKLLNLTPISGGSRAATPTTSSPIRRHVELRLVRALLDAPSVSLCRCLTSALFRRPSDASASLILTHLETYGATRLFTQMPAGSGSLSYGILLQSINTFLRRSRVRPRTRVAAAQKKLEDGHKECLRALEARRELKRRQQTRLMPLQQPVAMSDDDIVMVDDSDGSGDLDDSDSDSSSDSSSDSNSDSGSSDSDDGAVVISDN